MDWRKRQLQTALEDVARHLDIWADGSWIKFQGEPLVVLTAKQARYVAYVANKTAEWISQDEGEVQVFAPDNAEQEARLPEEESHGEEATPEAET